MATTVHHGDCLEVLRGLPSDSLDACVTDPPYGLSFMGKGWDYDVPSVDIWREVFRVLKPGAHLLAFAGTRTQHRMAVNIEDAGFEIRDMIAWVYGSGFPKSLDVSKAIDKVRDWSKVERLNAEIKRAREAAGLSLKQIGEQMQAATAGQYGAWYHRGGHMFFETGRSLPSRPEWDHLRKVLPISPEYLDAYDEAEREIVGHKDGNLLAVAPGQENNRSATTLDITAPATDAARQWQGWGTALKPALEPITVARKPLIGTVAANVQTHGTGALNIDGCRVGANPGDKPLKWAHGRGMGFHGAENRGHCEALSSPGRWPANLIHDGSEEVLAGFPETGPSKASNRGLQHSGRHGGLANIKPGTDTVRGHSDAGGSAARFFKTCKWSDDDWHHRSNSAQPVNAAESLSPACETPIAHDPAETRNSDFMSEASPAIPASTGNCNGSTQTPNPAPDAETPENTDTIPTMTSPLSSSGCAPHAIDVNTNSESAAKVEGVNVQVRGMRFLYNPKASKADRDEGLEVFEARFSPTMNNGIGGKEHDPETATPKRNFHPTVKPTDLMRYLCRLVTPPGGTVLDPFMGSGSTGKAATLEGFQFVGIEREAEYLEIAKARIEHVRVNPRQEALL